MDGSGQADRIDDIWEHEVSPPLDFAVFGLAKSWRGRRWLESVDGDDPVPAVWLGHVSANGRSGVLIATLPSAGSECAGPSAMRLTAAAVAAVDRLLNIIAPDPATPMPSRLGEVTTAHAQRRAADVFSWRKVAWLVADEPIEARIWRFAGAWAGVAATPRGGLLAAVGVGTPAKLVLVEVGNGASYGVDFSRALKLSDLRSLRPHVAMPHPNRHQVHEDMLELLNGLSSR